MMTGLKRSSREDRTEEHMEMVSWREVSYERVLKLFKRRMIMSCESR
jgi:hypothetical protein